MVKEALTPAMRQWFEVKDRYPDHVLMFRMGDFYEMFYEDAKTASRVLDIALTSRNKDSEAPVPLAGIPYHALTGYLAKFVRANYKVAICEQLEDPKKAGKVVKRGVTRVVTAGVAVEPETLDEKSHNYLMSLVRDGGRWGFAVAELTTGEFTVGLFTDEKRMISEIVRREPAEIVVPSSLNGSEDLQKLVKSLGAPLISYINDEMFDIDSAAASLDIQFPEDKVADMDREKLGPALSAAGGALGYLLDTQMCELGHVNKLKIFSGDEFMVMDETAKRNLELTTSLREQKKRGSLLWLLDQTVTAMGARLLKQWLLYPLLSPSKIRRRHAAVETLVTESVKRGEIRDLLSKTHDLERLCGRISMAVCNARDLIALKTSLVILPTLRSLLTEFTDPLLTDSGRNLDDLGDIRDLVEQSIDEEPPLSLRDGGFIKEGCNEQLDELRNISRSGKRYLSDMEAAERKRTGIPKLKIGYNRVFGYYIEISNVFKDKAPEEYIRKQTLVNAERYITQELKEYEEKVLNAQERIQELEYKLFSEIRERIAREVARIQKTARVQAALDVLCNFAELAESNNYVRPVIDDSDIIEIEEGRHPVVEKTNPGERFIPNETFLDCNESQLLIITGPNMAGKSTFIRQVALITLMAQIGSFVPAKSARIGVVDRIFTRVGASDNLARGESTFMVEMKETAGILSEATNKSLIVLDEIGRGTSTFDGLSIAWAVTEHLHDNPKVRARTLFATHYHEIVDIAREKTRIKNFNIGIIERDDTLVFLHRILPGSANRSYGIQVAKLAGLPEEVIERAKEILANLESAELDEIGRARISRRQGAATPKGQLSLFSPSRPSPVVEELKRIDPMRLSPLEALNVLVSLKDKVDKG